MASSSLIRDELHEFADMYPYARLTEGGNVRRAVLQAWMDAFGNAFTSDDAFRGACRRWRSQEEHPPKPQSFKSYLGGKNYDATANRPDGCSKCDYTGRVWYGWHGISPEGRHSFRDCVVPCGCALGRLLHHTQEQGSSREVKSDTEHRAWLEQGVASGHVEGWWRGNMPQDMRSRVCRTVEARNSLRVVEA